MVDITTLLGKVSVTPRGEYSLDAVYARLDLVQYEGSGYLARKNGLTGSEPVDGDDWMLLAKVGDPGPEGPEGPEGKPGPEGPASTVPGPAGVSPKVEISKSGKTTTITITDAEGEKKATIQDGSDGSGAGDMLAEVYDPTGQHTDIFDYVDKAVENVQPKLTIDDTVTADSDNPVKSSGIYTALQNVKVDLPANLVVSEDEELPPVEMDLNADTLGGNTPDYYASKADMEAGLAKKQDVLPYYSNPNLLDNAYWVNKAFIVNQKGETEYTTSGYNIDRWRMIYDIAKITVEEDGLLFDATTSISGNGGITFCQPIEPSVKAIIKGKTITVSVLYTPLTNNPALFGHNVSGYHNLTDLNGEVGKVSLATATYVFPTDASDITTIVPFWFFVLSKGIVKLHAAKLELGSRQTLAHQDADGNWVLNDPPPNYQQELAKCQFYQRVFYRPIDTIAAVGRYNNGYLSFPMMLTIRPVIANVPASNFIVESNTGAAIANTNSMQFNSDIKGCVCGFIPYTKGDIANGTPVYLKIKGGTNLILDANL